MTTTANEGRGTDLLVLLHALVMRDGGPPGLRGNVSFGVRADDHDMWWVARFGATAEASFADERPKDADATMLLGEKEAHALLANGALPARAELAEFTGDKKLLDRFLMRYVAHQSAVDVRTGGSR